MSVTYARTMPVLDTDSATWMEVLRADSPGHQDALRQLHALLLRAARAELARRSGRTRVVGQEAEDLAHQATDDALVAILRRLPEFRGESKFTTWAYKFAILEVSSKLGRHFWASRTDVVLETEQWEQLPARFGAGPESAVEAADLVNAVRDAVETNLTARQRDIFVALVVDGVPLDALVVELDTDRNTIYKVMFDARRKIRAILATNGYLEGK